MPPAVLPSLRGSALGDVLLADPAQPLITFFDDASAERTELSGATVDNWVAKTANLLQDVLAVEPGGRVALALPAHWQAAVWLLACWAGGAVPVPLPDARHPAAEDADVLVLPLDAVDGAPAGPELVTLALRPLALPGPGVPPGVLDYDVEVRAGGDRFTPYVPLLPEAPALAVGATIRTAAQLGAAACRQAAAAALTPGDRVLVARAYDDERSVLAGLLAPLAAGSSIVLCRHPSAPLLAERAVTERVTAVLREDAGLLPSVQLRVL